MPPATIRPVTRRLPDSKELWEDTNLPMCCVVTPAASSSIPAERSLMDVLRCLHCGAPHVSKSTHLRPLQEPILLCYLCGKTSSTLFKDQQKGRKMELLNPDTFDKEVAPKKDEMVLSLPLYAGDSNIPRLAAKACPPVWWIVLDGSQSARSYWTTVGSILADIDIPPHVHVGIVAANATHVSSWDLTSDVPHVVHFPFSSTNMQFTLVPADNVYKSNIHAAMRAIADAQLGALPPTCDTPGISLSLTLDVILEFMGTAIHPGADTVSSNPQEDGTLRYAGGKVLCLLGNPPAEITTKLLESQPAAGPGGVAGAACDITLDKWDKADEKPDSEPTEWTPKNLQNYVEPLEPEDVFFSLGEKCGKAAFGVDLFVVVPSEVEPDIGESALKIRPFYGLPLLSVLTNSSGAPGPLLFSISENKSVEALKKQILARTPWQDGMVFGARLRSRISPGFDLEDSPIEKVGRSKLQLAPFLSSGGLSGPATNVDKALWAMGTSDPHTSMVIDYQVRDKGKLNMIVTGDGLGQAALKPVLQICFAYTMLEKEGDDYFTVRKMLVSSTSLPLASDSEDFYDAVDPEALASVLFHKLVLSAVQDGFVAAQNTAEAWLISLLTCVYQSAQVEQAKIEEAMEQKNEDDRTDGDYESRIESCDRLLDVKGGDLSDEEILLAQGHSKMAVIPLIVFSLMQCDALRPTMGTYRPSMDSRCAAVGQMLSMLPSSLSKCIAPSLQVWSTKEDEAILDSIDLNQEALQQCLGEVDCSDAVFLADSPQQILVYRVDQGLDGSKKSAASSRLQLGPRLQKAIEVAASSYRTRPPIFVELDKGPLPEKSAMAFDNILLEDSPTFSGKEDYNVWKKEISSNVHADLKKSGDIFTD